MNSDSGKTVLCVEGVGLSFPNGLEALRDVSFSVRAGEFVAVLGPSGCGKSSLLRVAAGLQPQSAGLVHVDRRRLGFTFQDATLLPWRTLQANVELLMELRGVAPAERGRIAQDTLRLVGLSGFERALPNQLSAGMRMRASLARSLALNPTLFLFDEPFGAVDEINRERLNEELLRLYAQRGFAALFVTHSVTEATFLAERVIVLSDRPGRILADIAVPFAYPRDTALRYTAAFAATAARLSEALREGLTA